MYIKPDFIIIEVETAELLKRSGHNPHEGWLNQDGEPWKPGDGKPIKPANEYRNTLWDDEY